MKLCAALCLALTLTSCKLVEVYDTPLMAFHGSEQLDLIMQASSVESVRLDPFSYGTREQGERFAGYLVVKTGRNLDKEQYLDVLESIVNEENYGFGVDKACEFKPSIGLRFHREGKNVDMLVCFECNEWQFEFEDRVMAEEFRRSTVRPKLVRVARELFPGDAVIRKLQID